MTIREPRTIELVVYMCEIQPELDEWAAARILDLTPEIRQGIAQSWIEQRERAEQLLELHLALEETEMPA